MLEAVRRQVESKRVRTAFVATLVIGLLTYLFLYTNTIFVHDSIRPFDLAEEAVRSGRWLLGPLTGWRYGLQLPWVIGAAVLACLFGVVCVLCSLLEIRSTLGVWLTTALLVTAPAIADTQVYFFTADCYMLAVLLATGGVWLMRRARNPFVGALLAAVPLCLSMGIYQSYLCWASTLMLLLLLKSAMSGERTLKSLLLEGAADVLALALATGLYLGVANVVLKLLGMGWTNYQNLNQMTEPVTIKALLGYVGEAYADVLRQLFGEAYGYKPRLLRLFRAAIVLLGVLGTGLTLRRKRCKPGLWVLCAAIFALLPMSMNAMEILNKGEIAHTLMKLAYVAPYLLAVLLAETTFRDGAKLNVVCRRACVVCLLPVLLGNWILANSVYTNLKLAYDRSGLMANRIVSAIEQTDDYTGETPVLLAGFFGDNVPEATEGFEMNYAFNVGAREWAYITPQNLRDFLSAEMGVRMNLQPRNRQSEPAIAAAIAEMPCYPDSGYIRRVGDVLVVKLGEAMQ